MAILWRQESQSDFRASVVRGLSHIGYHELEGGARPPGDPTRKAVALAPHAAKTHAGDWLTIRTVFIRN